MPTYTYRCQQCRMEQSVVHGMLEQVMPVCPDCGHFCKKVVIATPTVLMAESPKDVDPETTSTPHHDCGAHCALHRPMPSPKPTPLTE